MESTRCCKSVVKSWLKFGEVEFWRERLATPEAWITAILFGFVVAVWKNSCEMQQYGVSEVIVIVHLFSCESGGGCLKGWRWLLK